MAFRPKSDPAPAPVIEASAPVIVMDAVSTPAPPDQTTELRLARERIAELERSLEGLSQGLAAPGPDTPPGIGAGSPVTLVRYTGGRIYESQATVVAQLSDGMVRVRSRGTRETLDVAPHDGSIAPDVDRVGYHGYVYADPLAQARSEGAL